MSITCSKDDIDSSINKIPDVVITNGSNSNSGLVCGDTLWVGGYKASSVSEFIWKGVHQWQAIIYADPKITPANTSRSHSIVSDTVEILPGQKFTLIRVN
ncbi:MAG: hypothetical protein GXO85_02270 [Chlorobi bacterium]|nr:hypothetical protein [Chlorobiota bacterium]